MTAKLLSTKDPVEKVTATFDFTADAAAATITPPPRVTIIATGAADATPSAVLNGAPSVTGLVVFQPVKAGLANVTYLLRCEVDLSDGRLLAKTSLLPVVNA